jgi:hypothetical protein
VGSVNEEPTPICEECGAAYVIEDVYTQFLVDFESRVGFAYEHRRQPPWLKRFCSEPCRVTAQRRRTETNNLKGSERKSAARKAKREGRSGDGAVG